MMALTKQGSAAAANPQRRPRLVVAATFPVHPPVGGGQIRAAHLYRGLSERFDIELVTLDACGAPEAREQLAPGLWEHRVPKSAEHDSRELALQREAGTVVTDIAMAELYRHTPDYLSVLRGAADGAHAMVACHPYTFPAIREVSALPVWYEAQDVEASLKQRVLGSTPAARRLLARVEAVERQCCAGAELIWPCCAEDGEELIRRYGVAADRVVVVPNGATLDETTYVSPSERAERRRRLRLPDRILAVFVASWHEPNLRGARELLRVAARMPQVDFMIIGSIGLALAGDSRPDNVQITGAVSSELKETLLGVADVALNPVRTGSGTNLKMLDYFAAGIPVISTPFGARGLGVRDGEHYLELGPAGFPAAFDRWRGLAPSSAEAMVHSARRHVEQTLSWSGITSELLATLLGREQRHEALIGAADN